MSKHIAVGSLPWLVLAIGCGEVSAPIDAEGVELDAAEFDAGDAPDAAGRGDAALPDAAAIDADLPNGCDRFEPPSESASLFDALCERAAGFNPAEDPRFSEISCPVTDPDPGSYGAILHPGAATQLDGCPATSPIIRVIPPPVENALTQASSNRRFALRPDDRVAVRIACIDEAADCNVRIQITGSFVDDQEQNQVRAMFNEVLEGDSVFDIDVPIDPDLVGEDAAINIVPISRAGGTADVLIQDPRLVRP